jgi:hypothetical protein
MACQFKLLRLFIWGGLDLIIYHRISQLWFKSYVILTWKAFLGLLPFSQFRIIVNTYKTVSAFNLLVWLLFQLSRRIEIASFHWDFRFSFTLELFLGFRLLQYGHMSIFKRWFVGTLNLRWKVFIFLFTCILLQSWAGWLEFIQTWCWSFFVSCQICNIWFRLGMLTLCQRCSSRVGTCTNSLFRRSWFLCRREIGDTWICIVVSVAVGWALSLLWIKVWLDMTILSQRHWRVWFLSKLLLPPHSWVLNGIGTISCLSIAWLLCLLLRWFHWWVFV